MDMKLRGRRVAITGASAGIGAATAHAFAAEGAHLLLCARDATRLQALADAVHAQHGTPVEIAPTDLRDADQLQAFARHLSDIDILVNNAGDIPGGTLLQVDDARWRQAWELKLMGYIQLCRRAYDVMRGRGGVIVNNIGAAGEAANFGYIAGATANAALMSFTRSLGSMSLFDNVRVVGVNPGAVGTERSRQLKRTEAIRRWGDDARVQELFDELPLGRPAHPEEVADLIVFLASPRAAYISGSIHTIDGGGGKRPSRPAGTVSS